MGEVVDMILVGILCQECGSYIDAEECGYPRSCDDCKQEPKR